MKKIKKMVHSSNPKADFASITLTENQDKFLEMFNGIMDKEGDNIFNDLMKKISEKPEYIIISHEELDKLYKVKEPIWSGCATQSFLERFYDRYKKNKIKKQLT
jgi:hypothetical protein